MKTPHQKIPQIKSLLTAVGLAAALVLSSRNAIAQSTIANVYPNGKNMFQPSSTLSFTASSSAGVSNVTVNLTVTSVYTGSSYLKVLTAANGLTITGPATSENVSAVLTSNTLYSAVIQIQDTNGAAASQTVTFDTIQPLYTWEAVDWDYTDTNTSVSGLFIDNPQTNAYAGRASTSAVDFNNPDYNNGTGGVPTDGNSSYRPQGLETETLSEIPRLAYAPFTTNQDYDVGYNNGGNWGNYTRHYPAGTYNVFVRASDGNGSQANAGDISVVAGTASFANSVNAGPYSYSVKGEGWGTYQWCPLVDSGGSLAILTIPADGTASTMRLTIDGGNCNEHFYMLLPTNSGAGASTVTITNVYPDGTIQFQSTNVFSFTALSPVGISSSDITVQMAATNLLGVGSATILTTANGLTVSGPSTNLTVTAPLTSNMVYTVFIQVNDANGVPAATSVSFDTINPIYTFEAEDYNYSSGQFFPNPITVDAYDSLDGVSNVDFYVDDPTSGSHSYRNFDNPILGPWGPETEGCGDVPRAAYTNGFPDYDVGFNDSPNWENYTRYFPAGTYNVFVRAANGGGGTGSVSMGLVTSDDTVPNQTVTTLGTAQVPSTGNWQKYEFAPMKDNNGNIVTVTFDGTDAYTLRVFGPSSMNANFYMLMPPNPSAITVSNLYPNGTNLFQQTNILGFVASSPGGIATNKIVVTLNGTNVPLTFTGSSTSWTVTYPNLQKDQAYSATIAITSISGGIYNDAFSFDTYSPNYYEWEASDFDYTSNGVSGLFFDNPQTNAYNGLGATVGVDELEVSAGTPISEDLYRTNQDGSLLVTTQSGGDLFRAKFAVLPSWRINWFGFGDFCNYTRHYPAGTYKIVGRFTEGGAASSAQLVKIHSGATNLLGTFNIPLNGWNGWEFETLVDGSGNPVSVTLDGTQTILQLTGSATQDGQTINAGFFMLVPIASTPPGIIITASIGGGQITISFPTTTGHNYQVEYKNNLTDASWTALGTLIPGNGAVQSVQDPDTGGHRFYHVHVE